MSGASSAGVGKRRRRVRSAEEKRRIVAETYEAGASVSEVARRHDVNTNLLFTWRRTTGVGPLARADGLIHSSSKAGRRAQEAMDALGYVDPVAATCCFLVTLEPRSQSARRTPRA